MTTEELKARIAEADKAYLVSSPEGLVLTVQYHVEPEQAVRLNEAGVGTLCVD